MTVFHRLDKMLFWFLLLGALFIGFMALTGDHMPLSALMASAACLGLKTLSHVVLARIKGRSLKARRRYARSVLSHWALLAEDETKDKIRTLLDDAQAAPRNGSLLLLPLSPTSDSFNADAVISAWKKSQSESHITLAALCPAKADARQWAEKLDHPSVSLIDGPMIEELIAQAFHAVPADFRETDGAAHVPDWHKRLIRRIHPVKAGLYALLMLLLYLLGGGMARLLAFGFFLALTLLSLWDRTADQSASRSILEFFRALR